jgi:hypothetical protein
MAAAHSETDRAVWFVYCTQHVADEINRPVVETVDLLERHGLAEWLLNGYRSFHTQGFEYMAEMLTEKLKEAQLV